MNLTQRLKQESSSANFKKLRICLVGQKIQVQSRSSDTGLLWPLARGLSKKGHEVTIISSTSPLSKAELFRDGVRAFYVHESQSPLKHLRFSEAAHKKFISLHQEKPFDLVHCLDDGGLKIGRHKKNFQTSIAYDVQATRMSELFSVVAESDGTVRSQLKTYLKLFLKYFINYFSHDRIVLDAADGVVVTTPQQKTILERYYLYPDYHTYTVPYGVNLGDLAPREESVNFKLKLALPEESQIVLCVSDFTNSHEISPLIKAFEAIVKKNALAYLVIVGDGPRWKDVEKLALQYVLGQKVIMPKAVGAEDLLEYILAADVYIDLSSRSSGLEPSLIEAMAQKKIVIGSELSPITEIIEDGLNGYLVRPGDDQFIAQLLEHILQSPDTLHQMGEAAREKVLKFFDRDKMIQSLLDTYAQIIEKSPFYKHRKNKFNLLERLFSKAE